MQRFWYKVLSLLALGLLVFGLAASAVSADGDDDDDDDRSETHVEDSHDDDDDRSGSSSSGSSHDDEEDDEDEDDDRSGSSGSGPSQQTTTESREREERRHQEQLGFEIRGVVSSVGSGGTSVVVNGRTILLDASLVREFEQKGTLAAGVEVKIEGIVLADGRWAARKVEVEDEAQAEVEIEDQEVEIKGTLEAVNGNTITVDGQQFTLDAETVAQLQAAGVLITGAEIKIEGTLNADGTLAVQAAKAETADLEVKVETEEGMTEVKIEGQISAVNSTNHSITVDGREITLDADLFAELEAAGLLIVGTPVELKGTIDTEGNLVITKVEAENEIEVEDEVEVEHAAEVEVEVEDTAEMSPEVQSLIAQIQALLQQLRALLDTAAQ